MEYGAYSHIGYVRKCNEDSFFIPVEGHALALMMVADGMGGHNAGDVASRLAVYVVSRHIEEGIAALIGPEEAPELIRNALTAANETIYAQSKAKDALSGMGTTLTLVLFYEGTAYIAHVGDSRGYLVRDQRAIQITRDHSLIQELMDNGRITKEEMASHPQKNVITRSLGTEAYIEIDMYKVSIKPGDLFLLCSDGLIHYIDPEAYFSEENLKMSAASIAETLGSAALEMGGVDNITVVAARIGGIKERGEAFAG